MSFETRLKAHLEPEEKRSPKAYQDSLGIWTAGIGRNLEAIPFSDDEIDLMYRNDVARVTRLLDARLPWWRSLDEIRQVALADLTFNLGNRIMNFVQFLAALKAGQWDRAADELIASKWHSQVGTRAPKIETMIRKGIDVP